MRSPIAGTYLPLFNIEGLKPKARESCAIEINEVSDYNRDGAVNLADVEWLLKHNANTARPLKGDETYGGGDFRSRECLAYLRQADVVVTNPPFSLFREYVARLVAFDKQFLIIVRGERVFPNQDSGRVKLMKGLNWGELYNAHKDDKLNANKLESHIAELIEDDKVSHLKGIYEYLLTGNEKTLHPRSFTDKMKTETYERQEGVCPACHKHFPTEKMEADMSFRGARAARRRPRIARYSANKTTEQRVEDSPSQPSRFIHRGVCCD